MATITKEMTEAAYMAAKSVYHGKKMKKIALDELENYHGMNRWSAADYIVCFEKMMKGEAYSRTNNPEATEYFFKSILWDYGPEELRNALQAAQGHVEYYASLDNGSPLHQIRALIDKYKQELSLFQPCLPEEIDESNNYFEGAKKQITVNAYERNHQARSKCIEHNGLDCKVCGFNFEQAYGEVGKDYIHVHHIKPLSEIQENYQVDPINDLIPVCPNCHAMLHRNKPAYTIQEVKQTIKNKRI